MLQAIYEFPEINFDRVINSDVGPFFPIKGALALVTDRKYNVIKHYFKDDETEENIEKYISALLSLKHKDEVLILDGTEDTDNGPVPAFYFYIPYRNSSCTIYTPTWDGVRRHEEEVTDELTKEAMYLAEIVLSNNGLTRYVPTFFSSIDNKISYFDSAIIVLRNVINRIISSLINGEEITDNNINNFKNLLGINFVNVNTNGDIVPDADIKEDEEIEKVVILTLYNKVGDEVNIAISSADEIINMITSFRILDVQEKNIVSNSNKTEETKEETEMEEETQEE